MAQKDKGSFRDPSGYVFTHHHRVLRNVTKHGAEKYEAVRDAGLLDALYDKGFIVKTTELDAQEKKKLGFIDKNFTDEGCAYLLEHEVIPYISYPYEWSFEQLKTAALHHLELQLFCFDKGFVLSDATAYNIQFIGARPVFIDILSLRPYMQGEFWQGYQQFCMQFLYPLILQAKRGINYQALYRGSFEGISALDLHAMLSWRDRLSLLTYLHVTLPAKLDKKRINNPDSVMKNAAKQRKLSYNAYRGFLVAMQRAVTGLKPSQKNKTVWNNYEVEQTYVSEELKQKRDFVSKFVKTEKPNMLFDIGCNLGGYSLLARESGAEYVVGFDFDSGAIDVSYQRAGKVDNFLPLLFDAANPSPSIGWREAERQSFGTRANADALVALAFEHHLVIAKNIPMDDFIDWLLSLARSGVVEFVPKNDETVQKMLTLREDIFYDYTQENFEALLQKSAKIIDQKIISASGRTLYWYQKK